MDIYYIWLYLKDKLEIVCMFFWGKVFSKVNIYGNILFLYVFCYVLLFVFEYE